MTKVNMYMVQKLELNFYRSQAEIQLLMIEKREKLGWKGHQIPQKVNIFLNHSQDFNVTIYLDKKIEISNSFW